MNKAPSSEGAFFQLVRRIDKHLPHNGMAT